MSPGEAMNQQARLIPLLRRHGVAGAGMVGTGCFGVPSPPPGVTEGPWQRQELRRGHGWEEVSSLLSSVGSE